MMRFFAVAVVAVTLSSCDAGEGVLREVLTDLLTSEEPGVQPDNMVSVPATAETPPVEDGGDAADDPAIWVNPADPAKSLIIGTNKARGLEVYDLQGNRLSKRDVGRTNNVDVRSMMVGGEEKVLAAATNRTGLNLDVFVLDPDTGTLGDILSRVVLFEFADEPYGLCMYKSAVEQAVYVFANDKAGNIQQWQLMEAEMGTLDAQLVRSFSVATQPEGCVADDANGILYVGEEAVGVWKFGAEPNDPADNPELIARVGLETGEGRIHADVEGLAIYAPPGAGPDAGYLVASSQGNFTYVVYDRAAPHAYRGTFQVVDGPAADGSQETDGLDVTAIPLPGYPQGLFVAQDGFNTTLDGTAEDQNFTYASWADIAAALGL